MGGHVDLISLLTNKPKLSPLVKQRMEGSRKDLSYSRGVQMYPSPDGRPILDIFPTWVHDRFKDTGVEERGPKESRSVSFVHAFIHAVPQAIHLFQWHHWHARDSMLKQGSVGLYCVGIQIMRSGTEKLT